MNPIATRKLWQGLGALRDDLATWRSTVDDVIPNDLTSNNQGTMMLADCAGEKVGADLEQLPRITDKDMREPSKALHESVGRAWDRYDEIHQASGVEAKLGALSAIGDAQRSVQALRRTVAGNVAVWGILGTGAAASASIAGYYAAQ